MKYITIALAALACALYVLTPSIAAPITTSARATLTPYIYKTPVPVTPPPTEPPAYPAPAYPVPAAHPRRAAPARSIERGACDGETGVVRAICALLHGS